MLSIDNTSGRAEPDLPARVLYTGPRFVSELEFAPLSPSARIALYLSGMEWLNSVLDPLFRITGNPVTDFFLGTFLLAAISALLGELTVILIYLTNRPYFERLYATLVGSHDTSMEAARAGDRESYRTSNKAANVAFARTVVVQVTLAVGSLWPAFLALALLHGRFSGLRFAVPGTPWEIGYGIVFILMYIVTRIIFVRMKYLVPAMERYKQIMDGARRRARETIESPPEDA
ncbi:MAG: hypothetical protein MAG453_00800 [Calditrichaeota bacterium]|nr:hypothetical protein [Calditrichota bacterium]